jgi:DNA-binding XRE family transcriptional regulator
MRRINEIAMRKSQIEAELRMEQVVFAAKLRAARAVLDLSQNEVAKIVGLTQKSIHRIEKADVQPKMRTIRAIERFFAKRGISFESSQSGGFRLIVKGPVPAHH